MAAYQRNVLDSWNVGWVSLVRGMHTAGGRPANRRAREAAGEGEVRLCSSERNLAHQKLFLDAPHYSLTPLPRFWPPRYDFWLDCYALQTRILLYSDSGIWRTSLRRNAFGML